MNVKYLVATTWNRGADRLAAHPDRFRRVFSDKNVRVFENLSVLPRAFRSGVGRRRSPDESAQLDRVRADDFDPVSTVVVGQTPPLPDRGGGAETPAASVVAGIAPGLNQVRMSVAALQPSILVLSQTWYPGWRALVDGKPQPLLRVDYGFTGTVVGPGLHSVLFAYEPVSLRYGAGLTATGLLVCVWLATRGGRRSMTWWQRKQQQESKPVGEAPMPPAAPPEPPPPPAPRPSASFSTHCSPATRLRHGASWMVSSPARPPPPIPGATAAAHSRFLLYVRLLAGGSSSARLGRNVSGLRRLRPGKAAGIPAGDAELREGALFAPLRSIA